MRVSDVWRQIDRHIDVFTKDNFDLVPDSSGIYAWFYPLKVTGYDLEELIEDLSRVSNYDAKNESSPTQTQYFNFNWSKSKITLEQSHINKKIPENVYNAWNKLIEGENKEEFFILRKQLMSASILMPPLYIGKATNLRERCYQHRNKNNDCGSNFKIRFENFAKENDFKTKKVEDLIFVCIKTEEKDEYDNSFHNTRSIVEEILKAVAKPPYGKT